MKNNTICTVKFRELSRKSTNVCTCCNATKMQAGEMVATIATPSQKNGVNVHLDCYKNAVWADRINTKATDCDSLNTVTHKVTIHNVPLVDLIYFAQYGYKKVGLRNGVSSVYQSFSNSYSCGKTVAKALAVGYKVTVTVGNTKYDVSDVDTYDNLVKTNFGQPRR